MQKRKQKNTTKKYTLLDAKITIHYIEADYLEDDRWVFGHTEWHSNNIDVYISTKDDQGKPFTKDEIDSTVRHELFHIILGQLYFNEQRDNETLVEWLAQATKTLNKQGLNI